MIFEAFPFTAAMKGERGGILRTKFKLKEKANAQLMAMQSVSQSASGIVGVVCVKSNGYCFSNNCNNDWRNGTNRIPWQRNI